MVPWSNVGLAIDKCAQRARSQRSTLGNPPANADRGCFNCYHCLELALIALLIGGASGTRGRRPGAMGHRDLSEDYSGSTMAKLSARQTLATDWPSISRCRYRYKQTWQNKRKGVREAIFTSHVSQIMFISCSSHTDTRPYKARRNVQLLIKMAARQIRRIFIENKYTSVSSDTLNASLRKFAFNLDWFKSGETCNAFNGK